MTFLSRLAVSLLLALCLTQCAVPTGRHAAPIVSGDGSEPVFFTVKGAKGIVRQSQIMAALEDMNEDLKRDREAMRDPLTALVASKGANLPHGLVIITKAGLAERLSGEKITIIVPAVGVEAPAVPNAEITKAMPAIQRYCYTKMSRYFTPVRPAELRRQDIKR